MLNVNAPYEEDDDYDCGFNYTFNDCDKLDEDLDCMINDYYSLTFSLSLILTLPILLSSFNCLRICISSDFGLNFTFYCKFRSCLEG